MSFNWENELSRHVECVIFADGMSHAHYWQFGYNYEIWFLQIFFCQFYSLYIDFVYIFIQYYQILYDFTTHLYINIETKKNVFHNFNSQKEPIKLILEIHEMCMESFV